MHFEQQGTGTVIKVDRLKGKTINKRWIDFPDRVQPLDTITLPDVYFVEGPLNVGPYFTYRDSDQVGIAKPAGPNKVYYYHDKTQPKESYAPEMEVALRAGTQQKVCSMLSK